ncbi:MAG TPA: hypothetical protein VG267_16555 [Terracidiphilus sp.]|jgi:hypothetical protein|nr:hypothetical protein [Terracidiphilus sp.]
MKYEFNSKIRGLLRAALLESMSSFAAKRFPSDHKSRAGRLLQQIDDGESLGFVSEEDLALAAKALQYTLQELGVDEFFTNTGFDFNFGLEALHQLEAAMPKSEIELEDLA